MIEHENEVLSQKKKTRKKELSERYASAIIEIDLFYVFVDVTYDSGHVV